MPSCIFPHYKSQHDLVDLLKSTNKTSKYKGKRQAGREVIEAVKKRVVEETVKILSKYIDNFKYDPNSRKQKICKKHYNDSVLLDKSCTDKSSLLLGAILQLL